jgi:hypothetical protein
MNKSLRDSCIDFFRNEDIKKEIRELLKPLVNIVYNEIYVYVWLICIYNILLFFCILAILFLLYRLGNKIKEVI